jgi:mRNA-degrading endonuclease RelE of RelBE toxin-antitoxin system
MTSYKLACVTYKDKFSAGEKAFNDLEISYNKKIFAAGMSRLRSFDSGDYVIICAVKDKKKYCFIAQISEKLEDDSLLDWHEQGGMIWKYNFYIEPLTEIVDITKGTETRDKCEEVCERLKLKKNNLFNMRFCSERMLSALDEIVNIFSKKA